jgi:hypothetical protein
MLPVQKLGTFYSVIKTEILVLSHPMYDRSIKSDQLTLLHVAEISSASQSKSKDLF